ncbi:hypothetical protein QYF36_009061 [Acer negundo]|nr:hypothetical protein QYF36_009061 [Acer negundo]
MLERKGCSPSTVFSYVSCVMTNEIEDSLQSLYRVGEKERGSDPSRVCVTMNLEWEEPVKKATIETWTNIRMRV